MENKSPELEVAIKAALAAGEVAEKYFEQELVHEIKADASIVTVADKEAEDSIKKIISESFPNHSILGEETGHTDNQSDYTWYIDPIDGTNNFANGIPLFAVSIALGHKGKIIVGVVYNPATNSLFYAEKGKGAYCNDKGIFVSKKDEKKCIVTIGRDRGEQNKMLAKNLSFHLPDRIRSMRDLGCTAIELAFLSRGTTDGDIQLGLKPYDFAAGTFLVQEAGGKITKLDGSPWNFPENYFLVSNGIIHDTLLDEIKKQKEALGI